MAWVRAQRRLSGWLALFALALQLALSFGHIHAEDFAASVAGIIETAHSGEGAAAPDDGDRHRLGHADCAICAVIHLAATLLLPPPPQVLLPAAETFASFAAIELHDPPRTSRQPFQARAPPQA
jgi:hypothetical protein